MVNGRSRYTAPRQTGSGVPAAVRWQRHMAATNSIQHSHQHEGRFICPICGLVSRWKAQVASVYINLISGLLRTSSTSEPVTPHSMLPTPFTTVPPPRPSLQFAHKSSRIPKKIVKQFQKTKTNKFLLAFFKRIGYLIKER